MNENPFAAQNNPDEEQVFYLIPTPVWSWTMTDGEPPFYDKGHDGRLFLAVVSCPYCTAHNAVDVVYANAGSSSSRPVGWSCGACGRGGDIKGQHGEGTLAPREWGDDEWVDLPLCVVVGG